jgi:hypothetical protein
MAPVVAMVNSWDVVHAEDGRAQAGPYDDTMPMANAMKLAPTTFKTLIHFHRLKGEI